MNRQEIFAVVRLDNGFSIRPRKCELADSWKRSKRRRKEKGDARDGLVRGARLDLLTAVTKVPRSSIMCGVGVH